MNSVTLFFILKVNYTSKFTGLEKKKKCEGVELEIRDFYSTLFIHLLIEREKEWKKTCSSSSFTVDVQSLQCFLKQTVVLAIIYIQNILTLQIGIFYSQQRNIWSSHR